MTDKPTYEDLEKRVKELEQIEEKLRISEGRYRNILESAPILCLIYQDGVVEYINQFGCTLLGAKRQELIVGHSVFDYVHQESKETTKQRAAKVKTGQIVPPADIRIRKLNGETAYLQSISIPYTSGGGQAALVMAVDVTERKEAEKALKESETRMNAFFKYSPIAMGIWDRKFRYVYVNDTLCRMNGPSYEEHIGHSIDEVLPKAAHIIRPLFEEILSSGKALENLQLKGEVPSKPGQITHYLVSYFPIFNSNGQVQFIGGCITDVAGLKRVEESLQLSEERFNLAMKASQDGLYDWDLKTNEIYYSPSWKKILGYKDDELPNDFSIWENLTKPEDVKRSWAMQNDLINKKRDRFELEFKMKHKDGHWVDILSRADAIYNDKGEAVRIVGTHVDITERKRAEEALKKQNYCLEKAQELGRIGTWELDIIKNKLVWTDENCRIFGVPEGSAVDYGIFLSKVHPDDREYVDRKWNTGLEGESYDIEHRLLLGDEVKWVREKADIEFDDYGKATGAIGFTQDITDLKQSVEELNRIFELSPDLIGFGNITKGYYTRVNPAYEIFGRPLDEFLKRPYVDFIHPDDHNVTANIVKTMQSGQSISGFVNRYRCKDGSYRTIEWRATEAQPDGSVCVAGRDITDRMNRKLEKEKLEKQLQNAKRMESIGKLAGGIAHDFNNILYPIIGFTQLSMDELPKIHPVQENLSDILDGAKRARDLVKRILLFSRQQEQVFKPTLLKPVIEETLKLLRSSIPANINIQSSLYDGDDCVMCDETHIHEIVMNLCTNAYHAMEQNDGEINVSLTKLTQNSILNLPLGDYLCLRIADNGSGISEEHLDKIFDPYFTTKEVGKGSGLGLSVVHGIVKGYNGDIEVQSELEKGTTIRVYLPLTDSTNIRLDEHDKHDNLTGTERILFVDDEKPIVKLGVRCLEKQGYDITGKQSSKVALELLKKNPNAFDLVITDMAMPELDGMQLAQKIYEINPDIPVLICSGYSEKLDRAKFDKLNIQGKLDKPIMANNLIKEVRKILDK